MTTLKKVIFILALLLLFAQAGCVFAEVRVVAGVQSDSATRLVLKYEGGQAGVMYVLKRKAEPDANWVELARGVVGSLPLTDDGLNAGVEYQYAIFDSAGTVQLQQTPFSAVPNQEIGAIAPAPIVKPTVMPPSSGEIICQPKTDSVSGGFNKGTLSSLPLNGNALTDPIVSGRSFTIECWNTLDPVDTKVTDTVNVTVVVPPPPTGTLSCTVGGPSRISLSWTQSRGTNVSLFRGDTLLQTPPTSLGGYSDSGLTAGTSYTYYLRNGTIATAVELAKATCKTLLPPPPPLPTGTLVCTANSPSQISLSWSQSNGTSVSLFRNGAFMQAVSGASGTVVDHGLSAATSYTYYLRNGNTVGATALAQAACTTAVSPPPPPPKLPDLIPVGAPAVSGEPNDDNKSLVSGRPYKLSGTAKNDGGTVAGAFNVKFQAKLKGMEDRFYVDLPNLASVTGLKGSAVVTTNRIAFDSNSSDTQTYDFRYCVDLPPNTATGNIVESNEGNNCSGSVTIRFKPKASPPSPSGEPSCVLEARKTGIALFGGVSDKTIVEAGESFTLLWRTEGADALSLLKTLSNSQVEGGNLITRNSPSGSVSVGGLQVGEYEYVLTGSNTVLDKTCRVRVQVTAEPAPLPDLVPFEPPVITGPQNSDGTFTAGGTLTLKGTPQNTGGTTRASFKVKFQGKLHDDGTPEGHHPDEQYVDLPNVAEVSGGLAKGITMSGNLPAITHESGVNENRVWDFRYCVDLPPNDYPYRGLILESDDTNNCSDSTKVVFAKAGSQSPTFIPRVESGVPTPPVTPTAVPPAVSSPACPPDCPEFKVSCSVSPANIDLAANPPAVVTWTADAEGGAKPYTYSWEGSAPLAEQKTNPVEITSSEYESFTQTVPAVKTGIVTVTDSYTPWPHSTRVECPNVSVTNSNADFTLGVTPTATMNFISQSAASTRVRIQIVPEAGFAYPVTISVPPATIAGIPVTFSLYTHTTSDSSNSIASDKYVTGLDLIIRSAKFIQKGHYAPIDPTDPDCEGAVKVHADGGGKSHDQCVSVDVNDSRPQFKEF